MAWHACLSKQVCWYRSLSWWRLAWRAARRKPKPSVLSSAWTTSWPNSLPLRYACSPATLCLPLASVALRTECLAVSRWWFHPWYVVCVCWLALHHGLCQTAPFCGFICHNCHYRARYTSYLHSNTPDLSKGTVLGAWHSGGVSEGWRGIQAGPGGHHPGSAEGSGAQQEGVPGSSQQCQVHAGHCTHLAHTHLAVFASGSPPSSVVYSLVLAIA